ncbi:MAG: hypothetical protein HQL69_09200 [Magnetococcales bacterium]|nr:hypothetical protein [Magnetococcales bacterium]
MSHTILKISANKRIPNFMLKEIRSKMAYIHPSVRKAEVDENGEIQLFLDPVPDQESAAKFKEKALMVMEALMKSTMVPEIKVMEDYTDVEVPFKDSPMEFLLQQGAVTKVGSGLYSLGPMMTRLLRYFQAKMEELALVSGADPRSFPAMIPAEYLEKLKYLRNFPHSMTFVTHLREDLDTIDTFAKQAHTHKGDIKMQDGSLAEVRNLLSPAICYHNYLALANSTLGQDPTVTVASGNCFRYESSNMDGLERLWNFTMLEIIFVGSKDKVLEGITQITGEASKILQKVGLSFRIESANDPFFLDDFGVQSNFQYARDLKYEFLATLPYKDSLFAIGSRNYHQDFFGRSNNIKDQQGKIAHTGCVGFGLERLAYAFVAQYGPDPKDWPENVRTEIYGEST